MQSAHILPNPALILSCQPWRERGHGRTRTLTCAYALVSTQAIKSLAITMDEGLELLGRSAGGSGGTSRASSEHGGASSEGCRRRTRKNKEEHHPRSSVGTSFVSGLAKHVDGLIEVSSKTILPCVCACARLHSHTHTCLFVFCLSRVVFSFGRTLSRNRVDV